MLRVVLWCAVSSAPQAAEDKTSLADQRQAGERFAAAVGGQVVATYTVPGHSRDYVFWQDAEAAMPAYRQLREDCEHRAFDVLHAVDADRLGRTAALIHQVIGAVEASGAEVYLASNPHPIGQSSVAQRYIAAIQAVRSEEDNAIRRARLHRGMRGRVRRGLCPTRWPYGYEPIRDATGSVVKARFVAEQEVALRHITRLFLAGLSYAAIAQECIAAGYPTQQGGGWESARVRGLMYNDVYAGYPSWGETRPEQPSTLYPLLWDEDTYAAVLRERRMRGTRPYHQSSLLDVAFCARCGGRMSRCRMHVGSRYEHNYMRCAEHARDVTACHANLIDTATVRRALVDHLVAALASPGALEELAVTNDVPLAELRRELAGLDAKLEAIGAQRSTLAMTLATGQLDAQMYRQTDDLLIEQLDGVNAARASVERQMDALPTPHERLATLAQLRDALDGLWELPPREAAALLQKVGVRVFVEEGEVVQVGFVQPA